MFIGSFASSYLIGQDLWEIVNGFEADDRPGIMRHRKSGKSSARRAMYILQSTVYKENHLHIQDMEKPKETRDILKKVHSRSIEVQLQLLENEIEDLKQGTLSISQYFQKGKLLLAS